MRKKLKMSISFSVEIFNFTIEKKKKSFCILHGQVFVMGKKAEGLFSYQYIYCSLFSSSIVFTYLLGVETTNTKPQMVGEKFPHPINNGNIGKLV